MRFLERLMPLGPFSVREGIPSKCPGRTSVFASFRYSPEAVEAVKEAGCGEARWDKKKEEWELPLSRLPGLLDRLCRLGEVALSLYASEEKGEPPLTRDEKEELSKLKKRPMAHQLAACDFLLSKGKGLLLDSQGVGKSVSAMLFAEALANRGKIDHCLVVCGVDALRQNWKREIESFSNRGCRVLGEKVSRTGSVGYASGKEKAEELKAGIREFYVVVNAAALRDDRVADALRKALSSRRWAIVADECHRLSNPGAQQTKAFLKLDAPYEVCMTGTPIVNSPLSAYAMLKAVGREKASYSAFKGHYCEFGGWGGWQVVGYKDLPLLRDELEGAALRRTLSDVREDMPPKTVEWQLVEMEPAQKAFYERVKEGVRSDLDKVELDAANLLALATRLRQATECPSVLTSEDIPSCKALRAAELARELAEQGEKVVVFSTFKRGAEEVAELLKDLDPFLVTGDSKEGYAADAVRLFQEDPARKVFVGTHAKCGTGLTLNAASYMICLDSPWTYASLSQSTDRIWRVTNDRPAFVRILECPGTFDERVRAIVENKKDLSDYLADGKPSAGLAAALKEALLGL